MANKGKQARRDAAARKEAASRARAEARAQAEGRAQAAAAEQDPDRSVIPWLRRLGFGITEARSAAELCKDIGDAPMEQRIRVALTHFHPRGTVQRAMTAIPATV